MLLQAFGNSILIGTVSTAFATFLGTLGAWLLYRYNFPTHRFMKTFIFVPMIMPGILMGVLLLVLFLFFLLLGYFSIIIAHLTFIFPFVLIGMQSRLQDMDLSPEEAAPHLGVLLALLFLICFFIPGRKKPSAHPI